MTVYRIEVQCEGEEPQPWEAFTDDEGVAQIRAGDLVCGCGCWAWLQLVSARPATEQEIADHPLH